jgi:RNA polymerase sigma-70 factor (ECF subfamily)
VTVRLWAEIAALPIAQREALLLRDWHGLSYAEIAQIARTNITTVTSRIHDARVALRHRMGRYL